MKVTITFETERATEGLTKSNVFDAFYAKLNDMTTFDVQPDCHEAADVFGLTGISVTE